MRERQRRLLGRLERLGDALAVARYRLLGVTGLRRRPRILPYRGYGTRHRIRLAGRVLEDRRPQREGASTSRRQALADAFRRLLATPTPHAELQASLDGDGWNVPCDARGAFDVWLEPRRPLDDDAIWHHLSLELRRPAGHDSRATAEILTPAPESRFVVVSDIDDTVVPTHATHLVRMLWRTFFTAARDRLPFPGVSAFYRALHAGAAGSDRNPVLYVSRGPWTGYEVLSELFQAHDIPLGPVLFLRRWGLSAEGLTPARPRGHKFRLVTGMLETFAELPFILVGDSGQLDPEIYAEVVREHPGRILATYIRDVVSEPNRRRAVERIAGEIRDAGSELVLAADTTAMAQHAFRRNFITAEAFAVMGVPDTGVGSPA